MKIAFVVVAVAVATASLLYDRKINEKPLGTHSLSDIQ